jgi:hypothetical protein
MANTDSTTETPGRYVTFTDDPAAAAADIAADADYEALLHKTIAELRRSPADVARLPALLAAIARGEVVWLQRRRSERRV